MVQFTFHPDAIEHNIRTIADIAAAAGRGASARPERTPPQLCAIIKANGYGIGAARLIPAIERAGVSAVGVFCTDEARAVAELVDVPVLVLGPAWDLDRDDPALARAIAAGRLHVVAHGLDHLRHLIGVAATLPAGAAPLPIHIEVDTGLGRGGAGPDMARHLVQLVRSAPGLRLAGVMTHFADASLPGGRAGDQERAFAQWVASVLAELPHDCVIHQVSTTTLFAGSQQMVDMLRIGLGMFGCGGVADADPALHRQLRGAITLHAPIVLTRDIPAGSPIGYGGTFVTARATRIAIVPVGYSHGFPRLNSNAQAVVLGATGRHTVPILGRVGMDQMVIDATDLPASDLGSPGKGPMVELIGHDPIGPTSLQAVATAGSMIPHELICRLGNAMRPSIVRGAALIR
jgi:alanine racemase